MKLDNSIQMAVEHVLYQNSKECAKWAVHVTNFNKYVNVNAAEPENFSGKMS